MTCLNVHLLHQIPATPAIIFFAAEHLYSVKLTRYLFAIPHNDTRERMFLYKGHKRRGRKPDGEDRCTFLYFGECMFAFLPGRSAVQPFFAGKIALTA